MDLRYEVLDVFAAVQKIPDFTENVSRWGRVVLREERLKLLVGFREHVCEILLGLFQLRTRGIVTAAHLLQRHIQLEDLFQKFRRDVFRTLLADVKAFQG